MHAYQASASLAGEKGPSPIFDYDNYMKCPFIEEALNEQTKQAIAENGIRNIAIMSIAPTGSISNIVLSYQNGNKNYIGVSGVELNQYLQLIILGEQNPLKMIINFIKFFIQQCKRILINIIYKIN